MDKKQAGVIGLIALIAGFGGSEVLTVDQISNAYVCELTEDIGIFDHLSTSGKTAYYINNDGLEESVRCQVGRTYGLWIPLTEYAESKGVSVEQFMVNTMSETPDKAEVCGRQGCFVCDTPIEAYSDCLGTIDRAGEIINPPR